MQRTHSTLGGSAFARNVMKFCPQPGLKGNTCRRKLSACYAKSIIRKQTSKKQRKQEKRRKSSVTRQEKERHVKIVEKRNLKRSTQRAHGSMLENVCAVSVHGIFVT